MKKSTVNLVTALKGKLLEFPGIVTSLEKKEITFMNQLFLWIRESQEIFTSYNISEVSALAGLKSKIIATKYSDNKKISPRKLQLKIAAESLFEIQHTVLKVLNPIESKVEESRELVRQLLLIVSQTHEIKYDRDLPFDSLISDVWHFISSNEQLKAGAIKLKTSLTMTDIQLLIADELNLEDF